VQVQGQGQGQEHVDSSLRRPDPLVPLLLPVPLFLHWGRMSRTLVHRAERPYPIR
jgi:hypothetical protein